MDSEQIKRNIYYYDWYTHTNDSELGLKKDRSSKRIVHFLDDIMRKQVETKSYTDSFVTTSKGTEFIIVDSKEEKQIKFRLMLCRKNALPYLEKNGQLEGLGSYIAPDQNIAEATHCVFFPEYGILGAEFNNNGARATSVAEYMVKKTDTDSMPRCQVKLNYDTYSKLVEGETFTLFDFSVDTNSDAYANVLANKSIFSAIQATVPESDTMEVVLKRRKTKRNNNEGFDLPLAFSEIKELVTNYRESVKKLKVSQNSIAHPIDLLADKFVGKTEIAKTENRMIDSNDMYEFIIDYFNNNVAEYCQRRS